MEKRVFQCDCGRSRRVWIDQTKDPRSLPNCLICGTALKEQSAQLSLKVFESVPMVTGIKEDDKKRILKLLMDNKGVFFKASDIAKKLDLRAEKTQVSIRKAILLLILDDMPIISSEKGFTYASSYDQVWEYIQSLEDRRTGLNRRINKLYQIYDQMRDLKVFK